MALPWLAVGQLVLGNLDKIIGLVRPAFTREKIGVASAQIAALATQVKELVAALEQAGVEAAAQRAATRRLAMAGLAVAVLALLVALAAVWPK